MHALKLIPVGDALGVALPREVLAKLKCSPGSIVYLIETPDGLLLSAHHLCWTLSILRKVTLKSKTYDFLAKCKKPHGFKHLRKQWIKSSFESARFSFPQIA